MRSRMLFCIISDKLSEESVLRITFLENSGIQRAFFDFSRDQIFLTISVTQRPGGPSNICILIIK